MKAKSEKKGGKKALKIILIVLLVLVLLAAGYIAYVLIAYHRIGNQDLAVKDNVEAVMEEGQEYKLFSWNIGFGAYTKDYDFFMDGGTQSWASSKDGLITNMNAISALAASSGADIYFLQEVDIDSTRTYHVDEREYFYEALNGMASVFAQNYDSPFLMYPLTQPHGASRSGLLTLSSFMMSDAKRIEFPVEEALTKLLDLDRCYSKAYVALSSGRKLVIYDFHLSAYTSDGVIATTQLKMLLEDMKKEFEAGNYCIAGGDFNKDLLGKSYEIFGVEPLEGSWCKPVEFELFEESGMVLIAPDVDAPVPTCRNPDKAYEKGQFVVTVDGFIVSPNVEASAKVFVENEDDWFLYSDHNPLLMTFTLLPAND
ncbi:MAG: nuclease [Clostridiales bacterium]|nr:nuclease [Clostridiales bacterium]